MSVIIRLQNLPWSANALDIRHFFRGLSIPEGGVHIVGGELGDAFIAFSTDEDARQAMLNDGGKLKEIQVKLLLSSRSEMHKVIEAARQTVPLISLQPQPVPQPAAIVAPVTVAQVVPPFAAPVGNANLLANIAIPGIANTHEIPQPAIIEPPPPIITSPTIVELRENEKSRSSDRDSKDRRRSRSRSKSRDKKERSRKRDRDRSRSRDRSRDRRRRDRSRDRSRDRRDRRRDRKDRSRSRDRSPRRSRGDKFNDDRKISPQRDVIDKKKIYGTNNGGGSTAPSQNNYASTVNGPYNAHSNQNRFQPRDPDIEDTFNRLQEIGKKRNPNAFQGENNSNNSRMRNSCCVAIRNAPNHTSYGDVRRFFPFLIDKHGIKMINDNTGRRTGTIYVRFCEQRSRQIVLERPNNELKGAQVVVEPLTDEVYNAAIDSYLPYRNDNDVDEVVAVQEDVPDSYTVLKVSDLPYFAKELDIIKLFGDFSLLSIIINDCRTTRTRNAFVQFAKHSDAETAYSRKETYSLGRKPISITIASDAEFEEEKAKQLPVAESALVDDSQMNQDQNSPRDPRQRRAIPSAQEVAPPVLQLNNPTGNYFNPRFQQGLAGSVFQNNQFGGFPQNGAPAGVNLDPRNNWGPRPNFPAPPMQQSYQIRPQQRPPTMPAMMNQPIPQPMQQPQQLPQLMPQPMPNMAPPQEDEILDCVLMKGLPPNCSDIMIVDFLSETRAVPARIHLMLDMQGVPSGDCFCEFRTPHEARRAVSKHGCELNGSRISVDLVSRAVVDDALEGPKQEEKPESLMPQQPYYEQPPRRGFPPAARPPYRGRGGYDRGGFERGRSYRRGYDRGTRGFESRGRGRGSYGRSSAPLLQLPNDQEVREEDSDSALDEFGAPGCVVCMENVPFRATVNDILSFFSDFDLTQDDVIRRFNERGQATGDARVSFRTPFDAQRAVSTRNLAQIYERKISLSIA